MSKAFHELTSEDIFNLIDEKIEIAALRGAELAAEKLEPRINCSNECREKQPSLYWWLGMGKFFERYIPYSYVALWAIALTSIGGVLFLLNHFNLL